MFSKVILFKLTNKQFLVYETIVAGEIMNKIITFIALIILTATLTLNQILNASEIWLAKCSIINLPPLTKSLPPNPF